MKYAWPKSCAAIARLAGSERTRGDRILREGAAAAGAVHDLQPDLLEALHDPLSRLSSAVSSATFRLGDLDPLGPHRRRADHERRRAVDV